MSEQLFPTPETFTLSNGEQCVIYKTKAKNLPALTKFIAKVLTDLSTIPGAAHGIEFMGSENYGAILQLIANFSEELPPYVAMHCSLTPEEIDEMDSDDYVLLTAKIIAYNKRFFSERVAPLLQANPAE